MNVCISTNLPLRKNLLDSKRQAINHYFAYLVFPNHCLMSKTFMSLLQTRRLGCRLGLRPSLSPQYRIFFDSLPSILWTWLSQQGFLCFRSAKMLSMPALDNTYASMVAHETRKHAKNMQSLVQLFFPYYSKTLIHK